MSDVMTPPTRVEVVGGDVGDLKERLKSLLLQLQTEFGILDRVVHKGKNQHRRCFYFKFVLKVRRDVRLLLSCGLDEILRSLFCILDEKKPFQRFRMLELTKKALPSGRCNYHERLLGVARLLSQMFEPIVAAAVQISSLLARSFFMTYSLLILALLARIRVLVQQMLLDVVTVFNLVSNISQGKHAIKLNQDGVEAFKEYYPPCGVVITLSCVWEGDRFVLHERSQNRKWNQDEDVIEAISSSTPATQYETIRISSESGTSTDQDHEKEELESKEGSPVKSTSSTSSLAEIFDFSHTGEQLNVPNDSGKKVAFIQVKQARPTETEGTMANKKLRIDQLLNNKTSESDAKEDTVFKLLTTGL